MSLSKNFNFLIMQNYKILINFQRYYRFFFAFCFIEYHLNKKT